MILVIAGMGFIGLHVVKALLDDGQDVALTWNRSWRVPDFLAGELSKRADPLPPSRPHAHQGTQAGLTKQIPGPTYLASPRLGPAAPNHLAHAAVKGVEPDYGPSGVPFAEETGDFTYVKDCAEVVRLVHQAATLQHKVYNVGGGRAFETRELAAAVRSAETDARIPL